MKSSLLLGLEVSAHQTQEDRLSRTSPATAEMALVGMFSLARGDAGTLVTVNFLCWTDLIEDQDRYIPLYNRITFSTDFEQYL